MTMVEQGAQDEFACLPAAGDLVEINGQIYQVRPLTVGLLPAFTRALHPAMGSVGALFSGTADAEQIAAIVAEHGDRLIDAVAIAMRMERATIADLDLVAFVALLPPVIKVNSDFFVQALRRAQGMDPAISGTGPTPSSH